VYGQCEHSTFNKYFRPNGSLYKVKRLCVLHDLLVREAHEGDLMRYLGAAKTLDMLQEHFYKILYNIQGKIN